MEYTLLGRSDLSVSRLCLGTMNFGPEMSEAASHSIMDRAHEHGSSLGATGIILGTEALTKLDELFPPPGPNGAKPARETYAW